jgi:isoquinoline 1-oxidoreductase alpha subunit
MIKLKVNGKDQQFDGDLEMPLLWYLRDEINLKGTKFGCGMGLCGACTIHLNGSPARACLTPVSAAANKSVTTIEGLSAEGTHPVQVAWQELDVPQCGYCQAGQIMSACALLAKKAKPTDADIDSAMNGNLCRCGTYLRVRAAIHKAAELTASNPATPAKSGSKASGAGSSVLPRKGGAK